MNEQDKKPKEPSVVTAIFTKKELEAIYRIVEYHYISYEDMEANEVINKIMRLIGLKV